MPRTLHDLLTLMHLSAHEGPAPRCLSDWALYNQALPIALAIRLGADGEGVETVAVALAAGEPVEERSC